MTWSPCSSYSLAKRYRSKSKLRRRYAPLERCFDSARRSGGTAVADDQEQVQIKTEPASDTKKRRVSFRQSSDPASRRD